MSEIKSKEEILESVKLVMFYDPSKTLTEQSMGGVTTPLYQSMEMSKSLENLKNIDFNSHDVLSFIEIGTGILGLFPTPLAPVFLGISTAAGLADAAVYFNEGDKYMGGLMLFLSIIPGGELAKVFKGSKVFTKRGVKGTQELIKKYKSGAKLAKEELDDLAKLGKIADESGVMAKLGKNAALTALKNTLKTKSPKFILNLLLVLKKIGIFKLSEIVFKVGGTAYGFDKLYLFTFRDVIKNEKNLDLRTKNDLRATVNGLLGYENEVNEYIKAKTIETLEKTLSEDQVKKTLESMGQTNEEVNKSYADLLLKKKQIEVHIPTIDEVLNGKKDLNTNKLYTISQGQKSDSVMEIQKMLSKIGYDVILNDFYTISNPIDGNFGSLTKEAVTTFQTDNGLTPDGIVGPKTLKKIIDIYNQGK
jgi:hypothetical protein